jgi:hypothetical protein
VNKKSEQLSGLDFIIAAIPLVLGASIYLLFRTQRILIFQIVSAINLGGAIESARVLARPLNPYVTGFVLYSLPAALWAFSFIFCIVRIWREQIKSLGAMCMMLITITIVFSSELAQAIGFVPGRFDVIDLIGSALGLLVGGAVAYAK